MAFFLLKTLKATVVCSTIGKHLCSFSVQKEWKKLPPHHQLIFFLQLL